MPIPLILFWQLGRGFIVSTLLPILKAIPWQVWVALGIVIAFFWYGHTRENKGFARCEVQYKEAASKEIIRQKNVITQVQSESAERIAKSAEAQAKAEAERDSILAKFNETEGSKKICLDESITDQLRARGMRGR